MGEHGRARPTYFLQSIVFCFEELQTVLIEVELIINNASLTYVYPNTIKTCLTPNNMFNMFPIEYAFHDTNERDKAREQM